MERVAQAYCRLDPWRSGEGPLAQLVEHYICNVGVTGSNPVRSTKTTSEAAMFCESPEAYSHEATNRVVEVQWRPADVRI